MTPTWMTGLRVSIFLLALVPLARLFYLGFNDGLGANPIEFVTRSTGTWTLVFVCIALAVTPLRKLTGRAWILRFRRMLGLYAFFYCALHLMTYVWFDQFFEWTEMWRDVVKRPFIAAGFIGFVLMVPLAVTSNAFSMRKLGRNWHQLHKLVYLVAPAGIIHFWWHKAGKNDLFEPFIYGSIVVVLLALRVYWTRSKAAKRRPVAPAAPVNSVVSARR